MRNSPNFESVFVMDSTPLPTSLVRTDNSSLQITSVQKIKLKPKTFAESLLEISRKSSIDIGLTIFHSKLTKITQNQPIFHIIWIIKESSCVSMSAILEPVLGPSNYEWKPSVTSRTWRDLGINGIGGRGSGVTRVCFGWVCVERVSKFGPRFRKNLHSK